MGDSGGAPITLDEMYEHADGERAAPRSVESSFEHHPVDDDVVASSAARRPAEVHPDDVTAEHAATRETVVAGGISTAPSPAGSVPETRSERRKRGTPPRSPSPHASRPTSSSAGGPRSSSRPASRGGRAGASPPLDRDLGSVAVDVYAAAHGVPRETAAVAASKSRVDQPDPDMEAASRLSPEREDLNEARPAWETHELAAAELRRRLNDSVQPTDANDVRNFVPPPLYLPLPGSNKQAVSVRLTEHHTLAAPGDSDADAEARREALIEKRAHVQMLRRQVEASRLSAESRLTHVARVVQPAQRMHRERVKALVETGEDHSLAQRMAGRTAPSPYGENLTEVFHMDDQSPPRPSPAPGAKSSFSGTSDIDGWDAQRRPSADNSATASPQHGAAADPADPLASYASEEVERSALEAHEAFAARHRGAGASSDVSACGSRSPEDHNRSQNESQPPKKKQLPDAKETVRIAQSLNRVNRNIETQRSRLQDLKIRLAAEGIDVAAVEAKFAKGRGGRSPGPGGEPPRSQSAQEVHVPLRLYPGHVKIPPPRRDAVTPTPTAEKKPLVVKEMDPKVLARLYREPHEFRPPPPVVHNIAARTAVIRGGGEPYRGDAIPASSVPKPKFTEETLKRCHDNEVVRREAHLKQSALKVEQSKVAEINRVRHQIGMAPLQPAGPDGKRREGFDRDGLPLFNKEKAVRLHDEACAHRASVHKKIADQLQRQEDQRRVHKTRKITKEQVAESAKRLHDASVEKTKDAMRKAAEACNAANAKTATAFIKPRTAAEVQEAFDRLSAPKDS